MPQAHERDILGTTQIEHSSLLRLSQRSHREFVLHHSDGGYVQKLLKLLGRHIGHPEMGRFASLITF